MSHNGTLPLVANWYLNQLATWGLPTFLAAQAVVFVAVYCGIGALLNRGPR